MNVGCIPKKLMHQTAMLHTALEDARKFGWEFSEAGENCCQTCGAVYYMTWQQFSQRGEEEWIVLKVH